jgi:hypothetical protein
MWLFNSEEFSSAPNDYEGFVYIITNVLTQKQYIGKKSFWSRRKDKKSKRRKTLESDWQKYYGSSDEIKDDLKKYGKENFKREILYICEHKKSMSYYETLEQFKRNVLTDSFYNSNILGKFFDSEVERLYSKVIKHNGD